jgi:hypothetical protein
MEWMGGLIVVLLGHTNADNWGGPDPIPNPADMPPMWLPDHDRSLLCYNSDRVVHVYIRHGAFAKPDWFTQLNRGSHD